MKSVCLESLKRLLWAAMAGVLFSQEAQGITIGGGKWIGTDKRGVAWYEEFQDWNKNDVRALDTNGDAHNFLDGIDMSRDVVALYSRDEGDNYYFRVDLFDLALGADSGGVDVYLAIDCALGGADWLPDFMDTRTSHPWELCVAVYGPNAASLYNKSYQNISWGNFIGSYWRSDLDAVEFGIKKSALYAAGWQQGQPLMLQVFTVRDGTNGGNGEIGGSDIVDCTGNLTRNIGNGTGYLDGAVSTASIAGRAKYAVVAHANQSIATRAGTQNHIYTNRRDINLHPGFVRTLDSAEMFNAPLNLHISGTLLMSFQWAKQNPSEPGYPERDGPTFLNRVRNFVKNGPGAIIGGTLAEHIMPYFEGDVNRKSIEQNNLLLSDMFGLSKEDVKVMHVPERVIRSETSNPRVRPEGPLDGKTFEDILDGGFKFTYLDEVTHLHWWFYPNEQSTPGWDDAAWGKWAGGQGNDEAPYHHKVHKINGVYTFMINDREDQSKFGNDDGGMARDTRYTLLQKALNPDYAQLTLVFDDWEAFAGNSFASSTPNGNADQFHNTLRWAANHPWIEIVRLKDVAAWAEADSKWVIDHGFVYDKSSQTYEWLKRACEMTYDNWYYGNGIEESFFDRVPNVMNGWKPDGMKKYGDMNTPGTLIRDSWDTIQGIGSPYLRMLAEWSYSAMVYETAWHDENPPQWWPPFDKPWLQWADAYQSRNYQVTFTRPDANSYSDDNPKDWTSGWAIGMHGHVRGLGVLRDAADWVKDIKSGTQGSATWAYSKDIDDDKLDEYVLRNNRVYLCFERWGARLIKAFVYDPNLNGGDCRAVIGVPSSNPPTEGENEYADNNRCSALKDRWNTWHGDTRYVDNDYAYPNAPVKGTDSWQFTSSDGKIVKKITLEPGKDVARADYTVPNGASLYTRHGLSPDVTDLMLHGDKNLKWISGGKYVGLKNTLGAEVYVVPGKNCQIMGGQLPGAGWGNRELPLTEQFETYNTAPSFTVNLAFSEATANSMSQSQLYWVGNVYHWPFNGQITSDNDLWINCESWPKGAGETGYVVYSTDGSQWFGRTLNLAGQNGNNDWWHVNLGKFPKGTIIQYALNVVDRNGNAIWANNSGKNYRAVVNP